MKFIPNHFHLLVKGHFLNPPKSEQKINDWFISLVEKVGMKVVAGPTSTYVNDLGNEGLTGTVTLATSHASIHIWDAEIPSLFQFDIYSCKYFDEKNVIEKLNEFKLNDYEFMLIDRNDSLKVISYGAI